MEYVAELKRSEWRKRQRVRWDGRRRKRTWRWETCLVSLVVKDREVMIPNQLRSKSTDIQISLSAQLPDDIIDVWKSTHGFMTFLCLR